MQPKVTVVSGKWSLTSAHAFSTLEKIKRAGALLERLGIDDRSVRVDFGGVCPIAMNGFYQVVYDFVFTFERMEDALKFKVAWLEEEEEEMA